MGPAMMGWGGNGASPLGWIVMVVFSVLVIAGVALLAIRVFRQAGPLALSTGGTASALDIVRERYARGEITREQFDQMRHDLEGK